MIRILAPAVAAALALVFAASAVAAQALVGTSLDPVGASTVQGTVTVSTDRGAAPAAEVTLNLSGLTRGATYTVHLHAGTYEQPAASFGTLGRLEPAPDGRAQLITTTARLGAVGAELALSEELLLDGDHFVDVHTSTGLVARARLPHQTTLAAPTQLPRTGAPMPLVTAGLAGLAAVGVAAWLRRPIR